MKVAEYPVIICGDMNNSAVFVYRNIRKLKDSFEEVAPVLDKPINSSTILLELIIFLQMKNDCKRVSKFSRDERLDHFPIMAKLSLE
jgi:hypothetical protein